MFHVLMKVQVARTDGRGSLPGLPYCDSNLFLDSELPEPPSRRSSPSRPGLPPSLPLPIPPFLPASPLHSKVAA